MTIEVGVAYAGMEKQLWLHVKLPEGSTAFDAITKSGIVKMFPDIDLTTQKIGIFGKIIKMDKVVNDGERIEIYRAITVDPSTVPRRDKDDGQDEMDEA